jgi:hypothetical protein
MSAALKALYQAYVRKFDEICAFLARRCGYNPDPAKLSDERRQAIVEEVEELIENWSEAALENWDLETEQHGELQRLLAEHYDIGERILALQHEECRRRGLIQDEDDA